MRRRILVAILGVTALAILLFGIPLVVLVERFVDQEATLRLERQAILAARDVPSDFATNNDPVELPVPIDGAVLGLYDTEGKRMAGEGPATADGVTEQALHNNVTDEEAAGRRVVSVPVTADERVVGAIRAEQATSASNARTWRFGGLVAALAAVVFAIGALAAALLARRLARPVRVLSRAAVALGDGDFTPTLSPSGVPEIDEAADSLARTAARLEELIRRERSFSADASHQLRTPLAGMRTAIETELEFPRTDRELVLQEVLEDIERLQRTVAEMLQAARDANPTAGTIDLDELLADARTAWHGQLARVGRPLRFDAPQPLPPVAGAATALRTAVDVLLDNALVHGAGEVSVRAAVKDSSVTISVSDQGRGFDMAPHGPTNGRGLALADRLVTSIGGRLVIANAGQAPTVDIVLSRAQTV